MRKPRAGRWLGTLFAHGAKHSSDGRLVGNRLRKKLSILDARMATTGQTFGTWYRTLPDGTRVKYTIIRNGPVPLLRTRVLASVPFEYIEQLEYRMENGLLAWSYYPLPAATYPLQIYCGERLINYFAGSGTPLPVSGHAGHVQGMYLSYSDGAGTYPYWRHDVPTLGPDREYDSTIYDQTENPGITYPCSTGNWLLPKAQMYTGLAKLLVQALGGVGRCISEIYGTDFEENTARTGLIRSPNDVYWLIDASSDGVNAVRLFLPSLAQQAIAWCRAGLVSGDDAVLMEAWALSFAQAATVDDDPGKSLDEIELLTAAEVWDVHNMTVADGSVFDGDHACGTIASSWGWVWSAQQFGTAGVDSARAIMACSIFLIDILHQTENHVRSHISRMAITWSDDRPSASVSVSTETKTTLYEADRLWTQYRGPWYNGSSQWRQGGEVAQIGGYVDLAAWFDAASGDERILRYYGNTTVTQTDTGYNDAVDDHEDVVMCAPNTTYSTTARATASGEFSKFVIIGSTVTHNPTKLSTLLVDRKVSIEWEADDMYGHVTMVCNADGEMHWNPPCSNYALLIQSCPPNQDCSSATGLQVINRSEEATAYSEYIVQSGNQGAILAWEPGAVWLYSSTFHYTLNEWGQTLYGYFQRLQGTYAFAFHPTCAGSVTWGIVRRALLAEMNILVPGSAYDNETNHIDQIAIYADEHGEIEIDPTNIVFSPFGTGLLDISSTVAALRSYGGLRDVSAVLPISGVSDIPLGIHHSWIGGM